jgi:hypothetical protein
MRGWIRDRSLGVLFVSLFLASWVVQLYFEWRVYAGERRAHDESATFWSMSFWDEFGQSTFENWQSEFLQLAAFTIATAYLVYKGSSESPDGEERLEAKLNALLEERGLDPKAIELSLPPKHQKTR